MKLGMFKLDEINIDGDYSSIPKLNDYKLPKNYKNSKQNNKSVSNVIDFFKAKPVINQKKCKKCNMCVESCPLHAIDINTKKFDYTKCIECMCCHELCLHKAVELKSDNILAGIIARYSVKK